MHKGTSFYLMAFDKYLPRAYPMPGNVQGTGVSRRNLQCVDVKENRAPIAQYLWQWAALGVSSCLAGYRGICQEETKAAKHASLVSFSKSLKECFSKDPSNMIIIVLKITLLIHVSSSFNLL